MSHSKIRRPALVSLILSLALLIFCSAALAAGTLNLSVPDTAVPGGEVEIRGSLSGDGAAGASIGIIVKDPSAGVIFAEETKTDSDGSFVISFTLPGNASYGYWQAQAAGGGCAANETFKVGAADGVVNVSPASVKPGGVVTISGTVPQGNVPVGITMKNPAGAIVFVDETKAAAEGSFRFTFTVPAGAPTGTWTVDAAGGGNTGRATFTVASGGSGGGGGDGGDGGDVTAPPKPEVDKYEPAKDAKDVALDALVRVTFKQDIKAGDLTKVGIKDDQNKEVGGVKATVSGKALTLTHDKFTYNTKYTVNIPAGTVKRTDNNAENDTFSWSFTTLKETVPHKPSCEFTDVPSTHWAAAYIKDLCEKEIIAGYPDGTFKPENNITRAEFAKIITGAVGLADVKPVSPTFADVSSTHWSYGYVKAAAKAGLVKGSDGKFRPNDFISRQEIAVILVRALDKESEALAKAGQTTNFKDDAQIAAWTKGYVIVAVAEGLINGYPDNTFGPAKNASRAESAKMVYFFMQKK